MANKVVEGFSNILNEKIVQLSIVCGRYFILHISRTRCFLYLLKIFKKFGAIINVPIELKGHNLLIFHSVVFAILWVFL